MISELCIFDLSTGRETVVLRHKGHIEAPNWHPDGYLVVNGGGLLYRVPLDAPALHPIDTGFAARLNNDHGLSPDGRTLAISDKTENGLACIYLLPVGGGAPQKVTEKTPSYWHGWSPDGTTIAYVGRRQTGHYWVYTSAVDGTAETCLTAGFDHADGPDYSPDGAWIWFNGERDGAVDIWRIRPDGCDLQQMTDDAFVNWFPHPSPDGRHVLYLAYPPETKFHPANLDVALCIIPSEGGTPRELIRFCGGQGSINVPCWEPNGQRFAFMRYSLQTAD